MNALLLVSDTTTSWLFGSGDIYNDFIIITLIIVLVVLLFSAVATLKAVKSILILTMPKVVASNESKSITGYDWQGLWQKLLSLKPIEQEKDIVIDHEYDGIRELDNPIPTWFNALFYSTVAFGLVYLLVYHVFSWGLNQDQEYVREMAIAEREKEEYLSKAANLIDEASITVDETGSLAIAGKSIFAANCVACHGALGEGGIGPNLTDEFWLHGGDIKDIFKVVKYGVPDKGMVPWEQTLTPSQIAEVSNYIVTLKGTNPLNGKEAQGEKYISTTEVKSVDGEEATN